jgi:hypothetical protein
MNRGIPEIDEMYLLLKVFFSLMFSFEIMLSSLYSFISLLTLFSSSIFTSPASSISSASLIFEALNLLALLSSFYSSSSNIFMALRLLQIEFFSRGYL